MIKIGLEYTTEKRVEKELLALNMGSGDLPVLATPALVAVSENAAMLAVAPYLEEGDTTVGGQINLKHLRPTPQGAVFKATATLIEIDRKKLVFEITALDNKGEIGRGTHTRFIVNKKAFLEHI